MKPTARIRIAPCANGKSLEVIAPTAMRPTPGQANIVSVTMEPPNKNPIRSPTSVTTGIIALRSAWRMVTRQSEAPLTCAVRT